MLKGYVIGVAQSKQGMRMFIQQMESPICLQTKTMLLGHIYHFAAVHAALSTEKNIQAYHLVHCGAKFIQLFRAYRSLCHIGQSCFGLSSRGHYPIVKFRHCRMFASWSRSGNAPR